MSIRNQLACLCLFAVYFFVPTARADEEAAIAAINAAGGTVRVIAKDTADKEATFHLSDKDVTDDALVPLKDVPDLVWVNLRGTKITDEGLKHLADLKKLNRLHLEKTGITDAGLAHLKNLENLEYLNLYETKVSDAGLEHLKGLKNLKKIYVWQTDVTKKGVEGISAAIPEIYINRGADAEPGPPIKTLANARYIKVKLDGEKRILSLAEVQVIETITGKDLQTEGSASQSSNYQDTKADRAIDGNVESDFSKGSVTHTAEETAPWWLLDLGDTRDIGKIVVYNRSEVGERLKDATVEAFDRALNVVWSGKVSDAANGSVTEFVAE